MTNPYDPLGQGSQQPPQVDPSGGYGQNPYAGYSQQPSAQPAPYAPTQYDVGQVQYSPYATYGTPKNPKATFGLWSLITALSGVLLPIGLNSIAAVVLGIIGLVREQPKGMSITGLVLGAVQLFFGLPLLYFFILPVFGAVLFAAIGLAAVPYASSYSYDPSYSYSPYSYDPSPTP